MDDVGGMLRETPAEFEVDWTADSVDEDAFDVTPDVTAALAEPVSDSTAHAVAVEADRLEARREALPEFLQSPFLQGPIPNVALSRCKK